jgi:hypothetical protein
MHFSSDNEQISRIFGESLGLDAGWNCHISLAAELEENCVENFETNLSVQFPNDSFINSNNLMSKKNSFNLKLNCKHSSLPNIKTSVTLYDNQTQTVKFDLSNIKLKKNLSNTTERENCEEDDSLRKPIFRQGSSLSKTSTEDFDRKKQLSIRNKPLNKQADDECSSHLTGQSGRTLTDSETLGNAVF